ncbi:luciferase-like [Rhodopseudomonas palustris HaA2]|uniref:Luciferase-like n=1 Tax=Rhodopseudomonas palustris (strain HaA2) TaxID=316058 RepID=Q2IRP4_RHOP2|nr:TIGR03619 family F420-dependent LLM class oxidoreductase [Rhodopseudomonas palustris]ABD09116.1 luciferase-like [Rhodopseudomonas palustris HaA2]
MSLILSAGLPTGMEGLTYPIPFSTPETLIKIAQHAEKLGYHSVWGNDHMTTQHYVREEFPVPPRFWEPLMTYAFIAANTTTLRFGTGILVLPMRRDIVVVAKQIATLDHFSNGRLEIGVGVGAYKEEFDALRPEGGAHRGDMVEEGVKALQLLFKDRVASFEGKYYNYKDVEFFPKPKQARLPIYFGGNNENHIRRVAETADGWIPAGMPAAKLKSMAARMMEMVVANGRDPAQISVAPQFIVHGARNQEAAVARYKQSQMHKHLLSLSKSTLKEEAGLAMEDINLIGTPDVILEKIAKLKDAGVTHLLGMYFAANDVQELLDQMQFFAEEVMPRIE